MFCFVCDIGINFLHFLNPPLLYVYERSEGNEQKQWEEWEDGVSIVIFYVKNHFLFRNRLYKRMNGCWWTSKGNIPTDGSRSSSQLAVSNQFQLVQWNITLDAIKNFIIFYVYQLITASQNDEWIEKFEEII